MRWRKEWSAIAVLIIAIGTWLRLARFAGQPALWIDELMFGLNIGTRGADELLGRLDFGQTAPPLFLLATRGLVAVFGMSELTVRVIPLAASIATLPLFLFLARRVLHGPIALVPLAMLTFSPALLRYANEARPYSVDVLVAVGLVLLATRLVAQPTNGRRWFILGLGGIVSLVASSPSVFSAAAIGSALVATAEVRGSRAGRARLALLGASWMIVFITAYITILKPAQTPDLDRFWAGGFPERNPWSLALKWMPPALQVFWPGGADRPNLAFGLIALTSVGGVITWGRRHGLTWPLLLLGPVAACSGAALAHAYPLQSVRVTLFAVPSLLLMFWTGVAALIDKTNVSLRPLVVVVSLFVIGGGSLSEGLRVERGAVQGENTDRVVPWLLARTNQEEPVYLFPRSLPAWAYYTADWARPGDRRRVRDYIAAAESIGPNSGNAPARGPRATGDGWERIMMDRGRPMLVGSPTGVERSITGSRSDVDSGWAENEAARVAASATPCIGVFLSHFVDDERRGLLAGFRRVGLRLEGARVEGGSAAYRYCRPAEPTRTTRFGPTPGDDRIQPSGPAPPERRPTPFP